MSEASDELVLSKCSSHVPLALDVKLVEYWSVSPKLATVEFGNVIEKHNLLDAWPVVTKLN